MATIQDFIHQKQDLFWSVGASQKEQISEQLLVETILNYGTLEDVKQLFQLLGLRKTAAIFLKSIQNRTRQNYFPEVENFFRLYFNRHVR